MFKSDYLSILSTQATTGDTANMMEEINRQLDLINGIVKETDDYGNLYVTKGVAETYPAFVCHTDTVHKIYKTFTVQETALNYIFAYSEDEGFQQVGVGGDDKSGIIACLELLIKLKTVKCVFFLDEEQGCKGSSVGRLEFFDDCRYAIQIDRKGHEDIIIKGSGTELCSKEFEELLTTIGKKYEYKPTTGATTDVVKLKDRGLKISACNLSAGYYNPHTKQEFIDADALLNCIDFCIAIARIKTIYPHSKPIIVKSAPTKSTSSYSNYSCARLCEICNEVLGYKFGMLCNDCVKKYILSEDTVIEGESARETCEGCGESLGTTEEIAIKHCYVCQICSGCDMQLVTADEFRVGECMRCLMQEFDDYEICNDKQCSNILATRKEKIVGYCTNCVVFDVEELCSMKNCRRALKTAEELETGLCIKCTGDYNG